MSIPYLAVEKVTESFVRNINVELSIDLTVNDKIQRKGCLSKGLFSLNFLSPTGTKTSAVYPHAGVFLLPLKKCPRNHGN